MREVTSIRPSFLVVSFLSIIWLGLAAWAMRSEGVRPESLFVALQTLGLLLAPVAALFALASALGNRESLPVLRASDPVEESEAQLTGIVTRIDSLRTALAGELQGLTEAAATLERHSRSAEGVVRQITEATNAATEATRALETVLPEAARSAETLRSAMEKAGSETKARADEAETAAATLSARLEALTIEGSNAANSLSQALETLEARALAGRTQSEAGMRAIRAEADTLYDYLENTLTAKRDMLHRQGESMAAQLNEGYARLEALANSSTAELVRRLAALVEQADAIEARLNAHAATTDTLATTGERAFQLLDARLQHSSETARGTLDRLSARVQEVSGELAALTQPLKQTQTATQDLDTSVNRLRETTMQTVDVLGETLPARTVEAGKAAETLSGDLRALCAAIDDAHAKAASLAEPISSSQAALEAASAGYAAQRAAIEAAGQALVVELEQARQLIGEVEEQTRDTSLAAATRLVDAMGRVREVASQATGTMREMLDGVLAEARESLEKAADEAMRRSFAEPIALKAREAEAAASAAAERTAGSMATLANALKQVEQRGQERLSSLEAARQEELLAAATLLTDRLAQASVSIATALDKPMDDQDWVRWRKGERSFFNKKALSLLARNEARELRALVASDGDFARAARDYSASFDALVRRFEDPAPALAAALQDSQQGRLAAALSEVLAG
ncbi:hypothetical protein ACUJ46_04405 [Sandaracinobacteroides sp. A072]|uniref:hypothetical protein n=1 Tax=Sandaracinobacteroides sp. A072 TaxID=3461146 RepID=UPI004040F9E5